MRWTSVALLVAGSLALAVTMTVIPAARASEVLDGMVATVNGHVILLSDWDDELRFECFTSGRKIADVNAEEKKAALNRLIDQELLREQMHVNDVKQVLPEEIKKQVESFRTDYVRENPGTTWEVGLSHYGLTEKFVENHVRTELEQLQFVDSRFRASTQVSEAEIEQYYKDQLVPKLPATDPVSLTEAAPKIREILTQSKINQTLSSWLETLRSQAEIRNMNTSSGTVGESLQAGAQ
jgi:hypothetical protein